MKNQNTPPAQWSLSHGIQVANQRMAQIALFIKCMKAKDDKSLDAWVAEKYGYTNGRKVRAMRSYLKKRVAKTMPAAGYTITQGVAGYGKEPVTLFSIVNFEGDMSPWRIIRQGRKPMPLA